MGNFLIFVAVTLILCLIGLGVWWLGNLIWIQIKKANKRLESEEKDYELAKDHLNHE